MPAAPIVAHLIVGASEELFLPALLRSLEPVVDALVVNDNGENTAGPNSQTLARSAFAARGQLVVDHAPFVDFATARNRTLALHRAQFGGGWAAFVDADEVHRPLAATLAANLRGLPPAVAVVDAYTRHYFQSFRLYTSIERRLCFFRVTPDLTWQGRVHERLTGIAGTHLAIPYVYDHYGAVFPMTRHAEKEQRYASLGQTGTTPYERDLARVSEVDYFAPLWPRVLRYHGDHPAPVSEVRTLLELTQAERFAANERSFLRFQSPRVRAANVARRINFECRWRGRFLDPRARRLVRATDA